MKKILLFVFALILLSIPAFWRMLRPGIYTMQDSMHFIRLLDFDKCVRDLQIPCRWAPDVGRGYGEPVFNFYGQLPYAMGEVFHFSGFSLIDSLKILFILSLAGSGISMFFLAKRIWGNMYSAILSSILYLYAPYRAVDVWVRGALPEALSFVFYPLIIFVLDRFFDKEDRKSLIWFTILSAGLILTHNLSFVLFSPVLVCWLIYKFISTKKWHLIKPLVSFSILALIISSFYLLPLIFEAKYVSLENTIQGYFNFRGHFATLKQLLFSRFWGYGASLFGPEEFMSRAVGQVQWVLPLLILGVLAIKKEIAKYKEFLLFFAVGWISLFLTHNKSTFIWEAIKPLSYIQFPWRFLAPAVFSFSLAGGLFVKLFNKQKIILAPFLVAVAVLLNYSFFKEDIWRKIEDTDMTTGKLWEEQIAASIGDYWPDFGHKIPEDFTKNYPPGLFWAHNNSREYKYQFGKESKSVVLPINYFPGFQGYKDEIIRVGERLRTYPSKDGLVAVESPGLDLVVRFEDTLVRKIGNIFSLASVIFLGFLAFRRTKVNLKK